MEKKTVIENAQNLTSNKKNTYLKSKDLVYP